MNQTIKQRWIEALRSGEYEQTTKTLHNEDGFCCLGVLCDLYSKEHDLKWMSDPHNHAYKMAGSTQVLPQFVTEWAGLKDDNPYVCFKDEVKPIAEVNDKGATFTEIAQLIEEQH